MRRRITTIPLFNYTGGEATIFSQGNMPAKYAVKMQNCHINSQGGISKVNGYTKVNSVAVAETLTNGFDYRKSTGTVLNIVSGGGKVYKDVSGTLTAIKTGLNTAAKCTFSMMNNTLIICNGVDAPAKYDGTTYGNLGGTPPSTAFKSHVHKGRVWMIERTNKMVATHSALNAPEDYTTGDDAGYIDFNYVLRRGSELVDMATFGDYLVFFFIDAIAIYSGSDPTAGGDFNLVQLIQGVGQVAEGANVNIGTDIYFVSQSGIKALSVLTQTGNIEMGNLSEMIDNELLADISSGTSSAAHYHKNGWALFLINGTIRVYSYIFKAWGRIVGAGISGMYNTGTALLYMCGNGYLYQYGSGYDFAGADVSMIYETAWLSFSKEGSRFYPKMLDIVTIQGIQTVIDIEMAYDTEYTSEEQTTSFETNTTPTVWDSISDFDSTNPVDEASTYSNRIPLYGGGRTMKLKFKNKSTAGPIGFNSLTILAEAGSI